MRFLLSFGAWVAGLSGGDRHLLESAARWSDDIELEVVAPPQARETIAGYLGDVQFQSLGVARGPLARNGPALPLEYLRRSAVTIARRPKPDVVVAASHFLADATTVRVAVRQGAHGVAFVYHLVADRPDRSLRTQWSKLDESIGLRLLAQSHATIFSSNAETISVLRRRGFSPHATNVGLDLSSFATADAAGAPPVILFVARLVPKKGLIDLVEALPAIVDRVPEARAIVAGTGPILEDAQQRAEQLGVGAAIEWRGFVPETEKRTLLARARVFAAPSYEEGWGISVAEAMASSLPVVAYELSTLNEVFGDAYVSVPLGSTRELATAIVRLLTDPAEAERVARNGRERVGRYDIDAIAGQELETILAEARR